MVNIPNTEVLAPMVGTRAIRKNLEAKVSDEARHKDYYYASYNSLRLGRFLLYDADASRFA